MLPPLGPRFVAGPPAALKVIVLPLTVMVSVAVTGVVKVVNGVVPVIVCALPSTAALPVTDALTKGCAGVPATTGLLAPKSTWLRPPAAVIVPAAAFGLASVTGTVGRFAAY